MNGSSFVIDTCCSRHSNNKVQRSEIIEELAELITKKNPGNKADLKNPEIAVVVEVIRSFCLLSIAPEYFKYKKYNLLELCNVKESENPPKVSSLCSDVWLSYFLFFLPFSY